MLNTGPREINHLRVISKPQNLFKTTVMMQCRTSLHLPLQRKEVVGIPFKDVPHLKSVVNKTTVHKISASDSDTVIHNANSSNIDTSVCDKNVHLDNCKPFACDNQPTYFDAGNSMTSNRSSIDTVNLDTIT